MTMDVRTTDSTWNGDRGGDRPLVSIIIPTYNRASLVGDAIQSALNQTYQPCEVIVVDDGSKDNTAEVVRAFGESVRYVAKPNGGVESAMNAGAQVMTGEYLCFLGDDDLLRPDVVARELAVMRSDSSTGLVYGSSEVRDMDGQLIDTIQPRFNRAPGVVSGVEELRHLGISNYITGSATLIRREAFSAAGGFNLECHGMCEDWDLWVRIACRWSVGYVPEVVQTVRVTPGHLLSTIKGGDKQYGLLANHQRIVETILSDPHVASALGRDRARIQAAFLIASASIAYRAHSTREARKMLGEARALYPEVFSDPELVSASTLRNRLRIPSPVVHLVWAMRGR